MHSPFVGGREQEAATDLKYTRRVASLLLRSYVSHTVELLLNTTFAFDSCDCSNVSNTKVVPARVFTLGSIVRSHGIVGCF